MEGQLIIKVIVILLGIALLTGGLCYRRKDHEEFSEGASSVTYSDSFITLIVRKIYIELIILRILKGKKRPIQTSLLFLFVRNRVLSPNSA